MAGGQWAFSRPGQAVRRPLLLSCSPAFLLVGGNLFFSEEDPRVLAPGRGDVLVLTQALLHLHRSVLCDDVATRSVAGRKPALHCA